MNLLPAACLAEVFTKAVAHSFFCLFFEFLYSDFCLLTPVICFLARRRLSAEASAKAETKPKQTQSNPALLEALFVFLFSLPRL
jgi:hypothetical protein